MASDRVDLHYRPLADGLAWLKDLNPSRGLVLGDKDQPSLEALADCGASVRLHPTNPWSLPAGAYALHIRGEWVAIAVPRGGPCESRVSGRVADFDGRLGDSRSIFEAAWRDALDHAGRCGLAIDDLVTVAGRPGVGRVSRIVLRPSGYEVEVVEASGRAVYDEADLERVAGDPESPEFWVTQPPAGLDDISFTLTWTKLRHPLTDTVYSYASSKTVFRPYQFLPVLKILNSPTGRILIADEVGLGKTIEAGLIWSELEQRSRLRRVLVVAPAALTLKWQAEMELRFDRKLDLLRIGDLRDFADRLEADEDPALAGIISINTLRRDRDLLERLAAVWPQFDLVIVDEAHAMRNERTSSNLLGQLLADWADYLVFLSATPLNLGQHDLFNLLTMLDEGQFSDRDIFAAQVEPNAVLNKLSRDLISTPAIPPKTLLKDLKSVRSMELGRALSQRSDFRSLVTLLDRGHAALSPSDVARARRHLSELNTLSSVVTRTRKRDVPDKKAQREAVQVDVDWTAEEREFYEAIRNIYRQRALAAGTVPGFAMQMPLRMAASCIPAMQRHFRERRPDLDIDLDIDIDEGVDPDGELRADVESALRPIRGDSKLEALRAKLHHLRAAGMRQVMVFSFFRGTLEYLAEHLAADASVAVLHGKVPLSDRQTIMDNFRAGAFDVLLLSQVGSEGLDFEFCNVLVNYDMPWNPMQVEQRIGRLDRFGQLHDKIFILNMHIPGTIETDIFERLYQRIGVFEDSVGDLEPILRDVMRQSTRMLDPRLSESEREHARLQTEVAIRKREEDAKRLSESQGVLAYADQLRIEGLSEHGPTNGRFVGSREIKQIILRLCSLTGATLSDPDANGVATLRGTSEMAEKLRAAPRPQRIGATSIGRLATRLQNRERIAVTFDAELASRHGIELLSLRHPLVSLALHELARLESTLARFGAVGVPGLPIGTRYVSQVDLVTTTGIRPQLELWVTSLSWPDLREAPHVEGLLLTALAEGTLQDGSGSVPRFDSDILDRLGDAFYQRRQETRATRAADNSALVDARIDARRHSFGVKIERTRAALMSDADSAVDERIARMHSGRIRNLEAELQAIELQLENNRRATISHSPVALMFVEGLAATDRR